MIFPNTVYNRVLLIFRFLLLNFCNTVHLACCVKFNVYHACFKYQLYMWLKYRRACACACVRVCTFAHMCVRHGECFRYDSLVYTKIFTDHYIIFDFHNYCVLSVTKKVHACWLLE